MTGAWINRDLGELATVTAGNSAPQDETLFADGTVPFFRTSDVGRVRFGDIDTAIDYLNERGTRGMRQFPKGTILFPKSGASTFLNHRVMMQVDGCVSSHLATITADRKFVEPRFLLYFLSTVQAQDLVQDHAYPSLNLPLIAGIKIPTPPLTEQRRIVAILDEAFESIATARANAERNRQNARTLSSTAMRSFLDAADHDWIETTIGDQVTLQRGFDITKDQQRAGSVPVVSSGGIRSYHDTAMVKAPGVVMGRKGTLGKVFFLEEDFWPHDTSLWVKDFKGNEPRFVHRFFEVLNVRDLDSGAANPALNRNQIYPLVARWPPKGKQAVIADNMDALTEEAQRLVAVYERKLAAIDELKKSLLHQAFSGQL